MSFLSANASAALNLAAGAEVSRYLVSATSTDYSRGLGTCSAPMIEDTKAMQNAGLAFMRTLANALGGGLDEAKKPDAIARIEEERASLMAKARDYMLKYGMAECEYFEDGQYQRIRPEKIANLGKTPTMPVRERAEIECSDEMKADFAALAKELTVPLNQMAVVIGRMMNKTLDGQSDGLELEILGQAEQTILDLGRGFKAKYQGVYLCNVRNEAGEKHSISSREFDQFLSKMENDQRKIRSRLSRRSF